MPPAPYTTIFTATTYRRTRGGRGAPPWRPPPRAPSGAPTSRPSVHPPGTHLLMQPHPRVEDGVRDVDQDVRHYNGGRREQHDADDHRQVLLVDRRHRGLTEPGQAGHGLDDDDSADQLTEVDAELRDHRRQRAAQAVPDDHPALPDALRARGPDVVLTETVEHQPRGNWVVCRRDKKGGGEPGQHQVLEP